MKKRYFLTNIKFGTLLFLFLILFGCMEEDNFPSHHEGGNQRLSAYIVKESLATRTTLRDNPTNQKVEVKWKAGDAIGVFGSESGKNVRYQTSQSFISEDGKSTVFETTETAAVGDLTVYYPYQQGATFASGGMLQLTMPQTQSYNIEPTGIAQPDPAVNMMAGKGKDGTIAFRNLFAILRVNIAGSDGQVVKKVLFTDLSGKPVSGKFSVTWSGDIPKAEFPQTGSGPDLQIELDCGNGVALGNNSLTKFFLIVPARNYEKGFKVEFVLASGDKITKSIGATGGKILLRNMLYPIGDMFPSQDDKVSYKMHEKASVISEERYDFISKISLDTTSYKLTLTVDAGFAPIKDEIIIINHVSTTLPEGYVGKVKTISGTSVVLEPVKDLTEIFEELSIGGPVWNSSGGAIAGGYAIDLSQYITSIETPDGKPVEFAVDGSALYMQVPITRAEGEIDTKFSLPKLSHNFQLIDQDENPNNSCGLTVGVQMDMAMYFHILIQSWSLKDFQSRFNPTINVSFDFNVDWIGSKEKRMPFIVVNSAPIPVGPVLICPVVELDLIFGVDGKLGFSAEVTYSKEFMVGVAYQNSQLSSYGSVVEQEAGKSPWGFAPKVQLEGGISIGVAPCLDFSLWKITTIGTRLNNSVKISANLNFDLSSPLFDPSLYNAFSNSKVSAQLEMYLDGSLRVWSKTIADTKSTTLQYPLYEAYFVPKLENFAIIGKRAKIDIELDISNSLVFKSEIGMNFYEKDPKTGKFTVEAGTMKLCEYSKPPAGKKVYNLKKEEKTNLPPGKEYEARLTVALDAPGGPYTLETDVKTRFTIPDDAIILTTTKNTGEKIKLLIDAEYADKKDVWIDLNNNGKRDNGEEVVFGKSENYTLGSKTFSIYGKISTLWCGNTQLTLLDVSTCKSLRDLSCSMNQLTSLDVSKSTRLQYLHCDDNQLTSLDVSGFTELLWLSCDENQLTSLDVSGCTKLSNLNCWKNKITSLNTSSCKALGSLLCYDNQLITLDASGCVALKDLECYDNQLVTLNISGCTALIKLLCYNNQITSLDVSSSAKLQHLRCENNQITSLDVSGFVELLRLSCANNQLTSLDVSGCTALKFLDCSENKLTTLDASSCSLNDFDCKNNDLTGIVPDYFQYITFISYDIRYVYVLVQVSENEWETVSEDSGKGYWYAHEPESGCHRPEPCK